MGFGERLKQAREAVTPKLTGQEMGRRLAVSKGTISHWETGLYQPSLEQLAALCDELNVTADWLLGRETFPVSADALREAKAYEALPPEDRRKWRAMRLTMFGAVA